MDGETQAPSDQGPGGPPGRPLTGDASSEIRGEVHGEDEHHRRDEHSGMNLKRTDLVRVVAGRVRRVDLVVGFHGVAFRWVTITGFRRA
nr:hypothetical protein [Ilumatobacter coccineus]